MSRRQQQGFSLLELMVALLLGTLIVGAAVQMFSTNQRAFQLQQNMSEVQETGRFAVEMMSQDLRVAGLFREDGADPGGLVIQDAFEGGTGATDNDQLHFRFYGNMDCQGDTYGGTGDTLIENRYSVVDGDLVCTGLIDQGNDGAVDADSTSVALVSNVSSFQVLYGVDREMTAGAGAADGIPFAGRYLKADEINFSAGDQIVSVRVGLLVRASRDSGEQAGTPRSFTVLDKTLTGGEAPLEVQAVRRLFVRTVKLRNYRWDSV